MDPSNLEEECLVESLLEEEAADNSIDGFASGKSLSMKVPEGDYRLTRHDKKSKVDVEFCLY